MSQAMAVKQAKPVKALIECMSAFSLSHACIVTDKPPADSPLRHGERKTNRQDTALDRGSTASEHEVPFVYGRIYLHPQTLESHFLRFEIFKRYIERNVVLAPHYLL